METTQDINIGVGIEVIGSYKRLAYTVWHAFAEFVDNSTQSYFNNKEVLDNVFKSEGKRLIIEISYDRNADEIVIQDNSIGMSATELAAAVLIGVPPINNTGRSKYGLGLKTAACWLGNIWSIRTKKFGENYEINITANVDDIVTTRKLDLPTQYNEKNIEEHYTIITITKLNRQFHGNTLNKVREFLMSIYRADFTDYGLILKWQGEQLSWQGFEKRLYITQDGTPYKKQFDFEIGDPLKQVKGWVGVLGKGSRNDAGFSMIQNKRVIEGWPDAYRPTKLFGEQESGTNNLVNQRLLGELYLDGFAVSHTKDKILWQNNEEEELNNALAIYCADAKALASTIRVGKSLLVDKVEEVKNEALAVFESELKSDEIRDKLFEDIIPDERAIELSYKRLIEAAKKSEEPAITVSIGSLADIIAVKVYFRNTSEFEPYVLIETSDNDQTVIVIINSLHPYWIELKNIDGFLSFIRHCVYDGLSEWKARRKSSSVKSDTIKYIKDSLLRLPFEILNNRLGLMGEPE